MTFLHEHHRTTFTRLALIAAAATMAFSQPRHAAFADEGDATRRQTAQWLVDRGRHLGITGQPENARSDADFILVWLLAAARTDPALAESYYWQYDISLRLKRANAARAALRSYTRLKPDDAIAALAWIDLNVQELQTAEDRIAFCEKSLAQSHLTEVKSDLHRRLAQLYAGRGDDEQAVRHARQAVDLFPAEGAARRLLLDLTNQTNSPEGRVELLLAGIAADPANTGRVWQLARTLAGLSMNEEAIPWYDAVEKNILAMTEHQLLPAALTLDRAQAEFEIGEYAQALKHTATLTTIGTAPLEASMLYIRAARRAGRSDDADARRDQLRRRFEDNADLILGSDDARKAALVAWFHIEFDPDPIRATQFAEHAFAIAPASPAVRRILGICRLRSGKTEDAFELLKPLAATDQWAADALSRIYISRNDPAQAIETLKQAERIRFSGVAYQRIVKHLDSLGSSAARPPDRSKIRAMLDHFDTSCLRFARSPAHDLELGASIPTEQLAYGSPVRCTMTLRNKGAYPMTVGPGGMIAAEILVSVRRDHGQGVPSATHDHYLTVSLAKRLVLNPGESLSVTRTLDIGPARELLAGDADRDCRFTFTFLLDPQIRTDGTRTSRLNSFPPTHLTVLRQPAPRTPRSGSTESMIQRARAFAQRPLANEPEDIAALNAGLSHNSPAVRAHWVSAGQQHARHPLVLNTIAARLEDPSWLVRLVALDTLARAQQETFLPVLQHILEHDSDPLVRRLASLYIKALRPANTH
jgi:tetratricopeptide (TPR) repeat protein